MEDTNNMTCCIYRLISPSNKSYIGQSIDFDRRLTEHKNQTNKIKSLPKLYQAFKKYGFENFQIEILEICEPEILNEREIYWIQYYDSFNKGYNCTTGGNAKFSRSKETRDKLSQYFTGIYNGSQNIKFTIDGIQYNSIGEASKKLNIPPKTIHNRLNSKNIKYSNYLYLDKKLIPERRPRITNGKPCIINGIEYSSAMEASKQLNISNYTISDRLNKNYPGYKFK